MDDATYTFLQHQREMNDIKRSTRYKKSGRKTKYVGMPNDNLTAKQRKEMNGPVKEYDMSVPHTYDELQSWPTDIAIEYLISLIRKYRASFRDLSWMLGIKDGKMRQWMEELEIQVPKVRKSKDQMKAWAEFLYSGEEKKEAPPPTEKKNAEPKPAPALLPKTPPMDVKTLRFRVSGKPYAVAQGLPLMLDADKLYSFDIIVRKEVSETESSVCEAELPCDNC